MKTISCYSDFHALRHCPAQPRRSTRIGIRSSLIFLSLLCGLSWGLTGAESVSSALQRGLTAEEAQRNLTAARDAYAEAVRLGDEQREALATALYRLGEVHRRLGDTKAAQLQFIRLIREFPEQTNLVALAQREVPEASEGKPGVTLLRARLQDLVGRQAAAEARASQLERETETIRSLNTREVLIRLSVSHPSPLLRQLLRDQATAEQQRARLSPDFGPQHPDVLRLEHLKQKINEQVQAVGEGIFATLQQQGESARQEATSLARQSRALELQLAQERVQPGANSGLEDDPYQYLQDEITLAEEQLKIIEKRFTAGQASQEEVLKARREILALRRQLASRPKLTEVTPLIPSPTEPALSDEEAQELARLRKLAAESPDLLRRPTDSLTPLQRAASQGWTNVVVYLLNFGVPANDADRSDRGTALHRAARAGNQALVTLLLDRGADVNSLGNSQETPLHVAVRAGHRAVAAQLIQRGAQLDPQTAWGGLGYGGWESAHFGNTPLHLAAHSGLPALVDLLIGQGANVNATNQNSISPLVAALLARHGDCLERLLQAGADPNGEARIEFEGRVSPLTPVQWAVSANELSFLKSLLRFGASPRTADQSGNTPLHMARSAEAVTELLTAGADVNARNFSGKTPLDTARGTTARAFASASGTNAVPENSRLLNGVRVPVPFRNVPVDTRPKAPVVATITGEVVGVLALIEGTSLSLREALLQFKPPATADLSKITLQRTLTLPDGAGSVTNFQVDLTFTPNTPPPDGPELKPGDYVYVPAKRRRDK